MYPSCSKVQFQAPFISVSRCYAQTINLLHHSTQCSKMLLSFNYHPLQLEGKSTNLSIKCCCANHYVNLLRNREHYSKMFLVSHKMNIIENTRPHNREFKAFYLVHATAGFPQEACNK